MKWLPTPEGVKVFMHAESAKGNRDVNSDGVVNILDLTLVAQQIGTLNPSKRHADVNKDGVVNILDLVIVAQEIE